MKKEFLYDAFISYRHTQPDQFVAENLHKLLEDFKLPGNLKNKGNGRQKINRVFRDRDELPLAANLEDPIIAALEQSEFLIVICSPRLKLSQWCMKEIDTFIKLHGRQNIYAVLVEGEPEDSFPEQLLYTEETIQLSDGRYETVRKPMEPLAADVRGADNKEILKKLKSEVLRLLAPIFGLSYDDLRQRHRERRMRRIFAASMGAAAVGIAFGAVSTVSALRIQKQKEQISTQKDAIMAQNEEIVAINAQISAQNKEISAQAEEINRQYQEILYQQALSLTRESNTRYENGDRVGAIRLAYEAITESNGSQMPYTAEAQCALTEALRAYGTGVSYAPEWQCETAGIIQSVTYSHNWDRLLCCDSTDSLYLFDLNEGKLLKSFNNLRSNSTSDCFTFLTQDRIAFVTEDGQAYIYDIVLDELKTLETDGNAYDVSCSRSGKLFYVIGNEEVMVFEKESLAHKFDIVEENAPYINRVDFADDQDQLIVYHMSIGGESVAAVFYLEDGRKEYLNIEGDYIEKIKSDAENLYLLINDYGWGRKESGDFSYSSSVFCLDKNTLEQKWVYKNPFATSDWLLPNNAPEGNMVLVATAQEVIILDRDTGSEIGKEVVGDKIIEVYTFADSPSYTYFTRNGGYYTYIPRIAMCYDMSGYFNSFAAQHTDLALVSGGIVIIPENSKAITKCSKKKPEDVVPYEGSAGETKSGYLIGRSAQEYAHEDEIPDEYMVDTVFFYEEEKLAFVTYKDGRLLVYSYGKDQIVSEELQVQAMDLRECLGKDKDGNYYISGVQSGYILNENFEMIGKVDFLRKLLPEENKVVTGFGSELYLVPIRSLEDLLAMSREFVVE